MLILFAYNFPHRKTQDFLFYCDHFKIKIDAVFAADFVQLNYPAKKQRYHIRPMGLIHPREICESKGIPYFNFHHNSQSTIDLLNEMKPALGLISGARILNEQVISCFSKGIINFHPGDIPNMRGLDTVLWSVFHNIPLTVTSHFIDKRVDAGRIICKSNLPLFPDDTLIDISLRLYEGQLKIFNETLVLANNNPLISFKEVEKKVKHSYKIFPSNFESEIDKSLKNYISLNAVLDEDARLWYSMSEDRPC